MNEPTNTKSFISESISKLPVANVRRDREFRHRADGKGFIQHTLEFDTRNEDVAKQIAGLLGMEFNQRSTMYVI